LLPVREVAWALGTAAVVAACVTALLVAIRRNGTAKVGPTAVVWTLGVLYFAAAAAITLGRHYGFATHALDLGFYGNYIYQCGRGFFPEQTLYPYFKYNNHFEPLLATLGPVARILPDPSYLLVLQAAAVASGVILVYYLARAGNGSAWFAAALAAGFAFTPLLHAPLMYDFHSRAFATPFGLGALLLFSRRRFVPGVAFAALLALTQDELAAHAVLLVVYGGIVARKPRWALIAGVVFAVYFVGATWLYPRLTYVRLGESILCTAYVEHPARAVSPALLSAKGSYFLTTLGPVAPFLPLAGAAWLILVTPLAIPAVTTLPNILSFHLQYPLSVVPFVYGAAALGLRRLAGAAPGRRRSWLLMGASVYVVAAPLALAVTVFRPYYGQWWAEAFPGPAECAKVGAVRRIPAGVPVAADDRFVPHLCHRRYCYIFYSQPVLTYPIAPEAILLERDKHPPADLPYILGPAATWRLGVAACTGDYALFRPGPGRFTAADLFRLWYGTIEERQCIVPAGRPVVIDPKAHDGRAAYVPNVMYVDLADGYIFPPGEYGFTYRLRTANPTGFCHGLMVAEITDAADSRAVVSPRLDTDIIAGPDYTSYVLSVENRRPFKLRLWLHTTAPVFFDAISINSDDYTLTSVARALRDERGRSAARIGR